MEFFPIFLRLQQRQCLVVGSGVVAWRKASMLARAGAVVTVVAPVFDAAFANASGMHCIESTFDDRYLDNMVLVVAATDDAAVNIEVSRLAGLRNIPVNVVDNPELCSFILPSILDRSPLVVAFSSAGASPVLARMLRARFEALIPQAYGRLAEFSGRFREAVKTRLQHPAQRRNFWENVLEGTVAEKVFAGDEKAAGEMLLSMLEKANGQVQGEVYLVGAGPGDPDLLTFRALRLMQKADVVLYDNLVSAPVLELTRREAERIYVGKRRGDHTMPQEGINDLLVRLAQEGKRVLRLKGGDPFIFGRGGEEIEKLAQHGIPFQVVPGITAANGVAAYAGIPLTHRDHAQSCIFVTGHLKDNSLDLDWEMLARPSQTIVVYMGLHGLEALCGELVRHGLPSSTPAAIVQQGTTPHQRVVCGTLADLPVVAKREQLQAPTLIIIGGVVSLHPTLEWFRPQSRE